MKFLFYLSFVVFIISGCLSSCTRQTVNLESLLQEMTDREHLTRFPDPYYSIGQFSSYDRSSTGPDQPGWFANRDYTHFIREENHQGRREFVLFDATGPGAIVRFWMTFAGEGASEGILRVYLDSLPEPVISDSVLRVISGGLLAGPPLSSSVSPLTEYERRGHNLYLPIPYARHCKVTFECDAIELSGTTRRPSVYYNINYRDYENGTQVSSLTMEQVVQAEERIRKTNAALLEAGTDQAIDQTSLEAVVAPGDTIVMRYTEKNQAAQEITLRLNARDLDQALRSTVIEIGFDGQTTVWVPAGGFFGTGYQIFPSKTWNSEVRDDGLMEARWAMPFKETMELKIINFGVQDVEASCTIGFKTYQWSATSMYFGCSWHEYYNIHSADMEDRDTDEWHFDVNYIDIHGQGVYVGDALTVFNTADAWWGEGDEKIFVDGESFPSCIGTGTEDYYGYAWCRPEEFSHPFIAQPTGAGNFHPGMTVNLRYRSLDAMPFRQQIQSNIELWHWALTRINMAMTTHYYVRPGFSINVAPDAEAVRRSITRSRSDLYEARANASGQLEGEWLQIVESDGGRTGIQSAAWYDWSENSQLWWHHAEVGDVLKLIFLVDEAGWYRLSASLTRAVDYGIIQVYINGEKAGTSFNGFAPEGVQTDWHDLGNHLLEKGENTIAIRIVGKDPRARPGNMAGIDYLKIRPIN